MEENFDPASVKAETVLKLLDYAFHHNTGDSEAIGAINAYRRLTKGAILPSQMMANHFGEGGEADWQATFALQEIEINRLRNEIKCLTKTLNGSKRRRSKPVREAKVPTPRPDISLNDAEWTAIENVIPPKQRCEKGRERISAIVVVLRTGCAWRVLASDEKPNGWTTYYNQYRSWQHQPWWKEMMTVLEQLR